MDKLRRINTTLAIIRNGRQVLLGEKKRGFAKGTLNGIGGKQDPGESIEQAMVRETREEIGVSPIEYELVGHIHFDMYYKGEHADMYLNIYNCTDYVGQPVETDEMIPMWFDEDDIPYDRMLPTDKEWMKDYALKNIKFTGEVVFSPDMQVLSKEFHEASTLTNTIPVM